MRRFDVVGIALLLWITALVPVVQQVRESLLFREFNTEWEQRNDFDLSQQFAGRRIEFREDAGKADSAMVSIIVDGRVALPPAGVIVAKDAGNLTRYHRSISQSRFVSRVRNDSSMLVGRLKLNDGAATYDLLRIDRNGRLVIKQDISAPMDGDFLQYRVFSQLGRESPPALPYTSWSVLQRVGGSFSGAFMLGILAPWVVLVVTSTFLVVVMVQSMRRRLVEYDQSR